VDVPPPTDDGDTSVSAQVTPIREGVQDSRRNTSRGAGRRHLTATTSATALLAVAAGTATALARGAPTEIHPLDIALKVLLAVACVLASRFTPWPFVALAAIVATAGSYRSPAALVTVAVFGIAMFGWQAAGRSRRYRPAATSVLPASPDDSMPRIVPEPSSTAALSDSAARPGIASRRRRRLSADWLAVIRAAACGTLVGVAVRSSWPHVSLAPSLVAAVVVLLILVPAVVVSPRPLRRRVLRWSGLVALAGLLLVLVAGVTGYEARSPLRTALDTARSGLVAAEHGEQATAIADFRKSSSAFQSAESDLAWARAAEVVPIVSQQIRAIRAATSIGESLAHAGLTTASTASVSDLKLVDGAFPIARLEQFRPVFTQDLNVLHAVSGKTSSFSSPWLVSALRTRLDTVDSRVKRATHDAQIGLLATKEVPGILGANGLKTYLVLVENPAESRGSGGVIGDYAEITADAGHLHLVKVGSVGELNRDGVKPKQRTLPAIPDFLDRYGAYYPQDHWENISMSPDFPTVAAVVEYLYPQSGGVKLNGVISVDPVAMAGFLKMVGPVTSKGLDEQVTQANVVSFLAHDEFVRFPDNNLRVQFVEGLLKKVWHELTSRPLPALPKLAKDLEPAVKGGHLLMYSSSSGAESFFDQIHVSGAMPPVNGDFLGVVTQNSAGNKIDWYLRRTIDYDATLNLQWHTITATVTVKLDNTAPSSGQPPVVIDGAAGVITKPGENLTWVNLYTPWQISGTPTLNGHPLVMESQYELGRQVYSAIVGIPAGSTDVLTVHLTGSWPESLSHYELSWYHQPELFKDVVSSKVTVIG
jgi:hypothetical protein